MQICVRFADDRTGYFEVEGLVIKKGEPPTVHGAPSVLRDIQKYIAHRAYIISSNGEYDLVWKTEES